MRKQFRLAKGIVVLAVLLAVALFQVCTASAEAQRKRWPIKTSLPADAEVDQPQEVQLLRLVILEDPPGAKNSDKRYKAARYPEFANSLDLKEGDIISTVGWLHLVATEDDGDYHIQISNSPTDGNNCLIVEVPKDDSEYVDSPEVRQMAGEVRAFIRTLEPLKGKEPARKGTIMKPVVYVRVTGQLFYDDAHVTYQKEKQHRGKLGMKAKTIWEIHPVTKIEAVTPPQR